MPSPLRLFAKYFQLHLPFAFEIANASALIIFPVIPCVQFIRFGQTQGKVGVSRNLVWVSPAHDEE